MGSFPNITDFSHELLCQILKYLPLREILSVGMLCKKMSAAVDMHLTLCKSIDFCQDAICGYMPSTVTDDHLLTLLKKCPHLETVYGLHPVKIERRRLRKRSALTIPGIIEALSLCFRLKAIETSDLRLFEAIMQHLPHIEIIGHFQNRDGIFPPQASQRLKLQPYPRISSLHLIGVEVPELTAMPHLQHLHLQCVRFTKLQPFRAFLAQNLKSFVMKHCIGPSVPQRYLSLIIALSSSPNLNHLELVRVPLLNGLFQRAVEDSYRHNGFVNLRTLVISGCKGVLEADLGHLMIVSSKNLETLYIQPSLTKDSLFVSLSYAQCFFPRLQNLHLGYIETLNSSGEWSNDTLLSFGLAEVPDTPSSITDSGMKVISELFPRIKTLSVSNCPHLMVMYHWMSPEDDEAWSRLTDLTLQKCHCLQLSSFAVFVAFLSNIEVVILNDMFREPPKGCSHVGLSAGTGLGMSSAVVSNQDEHIAVQGHHQDFEPPGDEENEENDREFIDVENEEPHFMVLQRDFFDGEEEEEEEEDGADAPMEGQNPIVAEQLNCEEHSSAAVCLNDGLQSVNKSAVVTENTSSYNEPSTSMDNKTSGGPSSSLSSEAQNENESKYDLRPSKEELKSVYDQFSVPIDCHPSSNSGLKCAERNLHDNACDMSDDSFKSDDIKLCDCSKSSNHNHYSDYDPHKPSTSKAGRHLDYSPITDEKPLNIYDSETGYNKYSKRLKKSSNEQIFLKTKNEKLDVVTGMDDCHREIQNNGCSKISDNISLSSPNNLSNSGSSSDEMYKLVKPCKIFVTKLEKESPEASTSNLCTKNSDVVSEPETCLYYQNVKLPVTPHSSLKNDCKVFYGDGVNQCTSPDINCRSNNFPNCDIEKSPKTLDFVGPLEPKNESLDQSKKKSVGKVRSSENEDVSENMTCYVLVEKLDHIYCTGKSKNFVEGQNLSKDTSLRDNEVQKNYEHLEEESTSRCNGECKKTDICNFCVPKTEDKSSPCCASGSSVANANGGFKMRNVDKTINKPQSEFEISRSYHKMCDEHVQTGKIVHKTENVCASSDNKFSSCKNDDLFTDEYQSNKKLGHKLSLNMESYNNIHSNKNVVKVTKDENIKEGEYKVFDSDCVVSVNNEAGQESVNYFIADENKGTSKFNASLQISKMQGEESSKSLGEQTSYSSKIKPCADTNNENLAKQNCSYSENSCSKYINTTKNEVKVCFEDEFSSSAENISRNTRMSNSRMHDPYQPSTSKDGWDYNGYSKKLPRSTRSTKLRRPLKNETVDTHPKKHSNSSNSFIPTENKSYSTPKMQRIKASVKDDNYPETDVEISTSVTKKLKKTHKNHNDDDIDSKYFVLVSDTSTKVINSSTGESHRIATCSVCLTEHNNENEKSQFSDLRVKRYKCQSEMLHEESNNGANCDLSLPSAYKQENQLNSAAGTCKLHTVTNINCSHKYVACSKHIKRTNSMKTKKRSRNLNKFSDNIEENKVNNAETSINEYEFSRKGVCCKDCRNVCDRLSDIPSSSKISTEKLKITNSDASVLIKNSSKEGSRQLNHHKESKCTKTNANANSLENGSHFNQAFKTESDEEMSYPSEKRAYCKKDIDSKTENISHCTEKEVTFTHTKKEQEQVPNKRTRKKRTLLSQKRGRKIQKNPLIKSDCLSKRTRYRTKKTPAVPMICFISQGTQANSADIRRSVRRIRRATARARRTVSSLHVSRSSTHSNKISAKMLNKKPVDMNPRPETHDKATSTSDPLLEDDAVQTLQLTSKTLLSFTVVSCGISDIIIDHCPKLFHIEVQACRILKNFHLNYCPAMRRLNIAQCPKLSMCALASSVMATDTNSYFLISYEPCMQGYHPGDGEKAILSRTALNQSVLLCHDFNELSHEGIQAVFKEKILEWFRYLSKVHKVLKSKSKTMKKICELSDCSDYPYSHDLRKIHGEYKCLPSNDFCHTEGQYQLVTNNPIFCDIYETHQLDTGFPNIYDCEAVKNISLISHEAREKSFIMENKFIGFYVPITENN